MKLDGKSLLVVGVGVGVGACGSVLAALPLPSSLITIRPIRAIRDDMEGTREGMKKRERRGMWPLN